MIGSWVFTIGLYAMPILILALGHGLRRRSPRVRRAFWGAVVGYGVGALATSIVTIAPPYYWGGGAAARELAVYGALVVPTLVGLLVGATLAGGSRAGSAG